MSIFLWNIWDPLLSHTERTVYSLSTYQVSNSRSMSSWSMIQGLVIAASSLPEKPSLPFAPGNVNASSSRWTDKLVIKSLELDVDPFPLMPQLVNPLAAPEPLLPPSFVPCPSFTHFHNKLNMNPWQYFDWSKRRGSSNPSSTFVGSRHGGHGLCTVLALCFSSGLWLFELSNRDFAKSLKRSIEVWNSLLEVENRYLYM